MRPEAGQLTVALAWNAQGAIIPLFFVFPPKRFKEHFLKGGPVGFAGTGNPSGWMKEEDFVLFLAHFVRHTHVNLVSLGLCVSLKKVKDLNHLTIFITTVLCIKQITRLLFSSVF